MSFLIELKKLLEEVAKGELSPDEAINHLSFLPYEDLGSIKLDHHRYIRKGFPEVIYGQGKTTSQLYKIIKTYLKRNIPLMITKVADRKAKSILKKFPNLTYHSKARIITYLPKGISPAKKAKIVIIAAGTADEPIAEEARVTVEILGCEALTAYDLGVAGLHRLKEVIPLLRDAQVVIVVAGLEGALPSVIAGMTNLPIIAVPTSIGYGANFGGLAALLTMLNSCAPGIGVVNIDNGFGAGYLAALIALGPSWPF